MRLLHNHKTIFRVKSKLTDLSELHKKTLNQPVFDEKCEGEALMENLGKEIARLVTLAHKNTLIIKSYLYSTSNNLEKKLVENVVKSLLTTLQNLTGSFRNEQNGYLKQINSMEEYTNEFFDSLNFNGPPTNNHQEVDSFDNFLKPATSYNASQLDDINQNDDKLDEYFQIKPSQKMGNRQLLQFEVDNTRLVESREKEVIGIVKSIVDLNTIYKDLSNMVQEQGTILDRIDYNVENTQTKVFEGYKQLQKAERYQRANRKMYCIMILAVVTLFMLLLLIVTKF